MKHISIDDKIFDIVEQNNDVKNILVCLGFIHLNDPMMYKTIAKVMTIRKAAKRHDISFEQLEESFNKYGYDILEEEL